MVEILPIIVAGLSIITGICFSQILKIISLLELRIKSLQDDVDFAHKRIEANESVIDTFSCYVSERQEEEIDNP